MNNIIESLKKTIEVDDNQYSLRVHVTAWNKLCICYANMFKHNDILCSVIVDQNEKHFPIEKSSYHIGNAQSFDEAAQMLKDYVEPYKEAM